MKANVILSLDKRRKKPDDTYPLLLRIIKDRETAQITTGYSFREKDWDDRAKKVNTSYRGTESVQRLNNMFAKKRSEALDVITKLHEQHKLANCSAKEIKELIEGRSKKSSFFTFTDGLIDEMIEAKRIGNARAYKQVVAVLSTFCHGKDLGFLELNYAFLNKFEKAHLAKGNSYNGLSVYMRTIRAIYNKAIKSGAVDKELYPFEHYQIKSTQTQKRAISMDAIERIRSFKLPAGTPLSHARNYFLFSFYMRGMSFTDLAHLQVMNIVDGRILYQRQKTDHPYNVKITEKVAELLKTYLHGKGREDFIFPIITREDPSERYKEIQWARSRFNRRLKKIAEMCGIEENLTSYVSRHSFATQAKNLNIPVANISELLGHQNIKTTQIYLDSLQSDALDAEHERIIG